MTEISVLIPCLNEEKTIGHCVKHAKAACESLKKPYEIIIIDNGSTDNSARISRKQGARVIEEKRKGYGLAYLAGIKEAKGKYIFTADGDGTYNIHELINCYALCETHKYDFIIGNRFENMDKDSMPFAHQHIGNPLFTRMINFILKTNIKDSNSGLRMIRASKLKKLNLKSPGMEFTSEMIIEAHKNKLKIIEIPTDYKKRIAPAKLRTFRDGLRILRLLIRYYLD